MFRPMTVLSPLFVWKLWNQLFPQGVRPCLLKLRAIHAVASIAPLVPVARPSQVSLERKLMLLSRETLSPLAGVSSTFGIS